MNFHTIDSVTLMKTIEFLDEYHWMLHSKQGITPVNEDIPLVLTSLRNTLAVIPTVNNDKDIGWKLQESA